MTLAEAEARWRKLVPEGARAWACGDCGAECAIETRALCLRTRDVNAPCGFVRDQPDCLELAWPFYVQDVLSE